MSQQPEYESTSPPSDAERLQEGLRTLYERVAIIDKKVTMIQRVVYGIAAGVVFQLFKLW
jgi:hypothetical protein